MINEWLKVFGIHLIINQYLFTVISFTGYCHYYYYENIMDLPIFYVSYYWMNENEKWIHIIYIYILASWYYIFICWMINNCVRIFIFCSYFKTFKCFAVYLFWIFHLFGTHLKQIVTLLLNTLIHSVLCSCSIYYTLSLLGLSPKIWNMQGFNVISIFLSRIYMQNININDLISCYTPKNMPKYTVISIYYRPTMTLKNVEKDYLVIFSNKINALEKFFKKDHY